MMLPYIEKADSLKAELQIMKQSAINEDRYMDAERYKTAFIKLDQLVNALEQLEVKKAAAITREDFVIAQNMKESIDQIQALLDTPINELVYVMNGEEVPKSQPAAKVY